MRTAGQQTGQLDDLHYAILLLVQADQLLAPLMQFGNALSACIFPHAKTMSCFAHVFKLSACRVYSVAVVVVV